MTGFRGLTRKYPKLRLRSGVVALAAVLAACPAVLAVSGAPSAAAPNTVSSKAAAPNAAAPNTAAWQNLHPHSTGKCADVRAVWVSDGAPVHQWTCRMHENQMWTFVPAGNGYFYIVARHSGKCLDVSSASTADGAVVQQWTCVGSMNQQWRLDEVPPGTGVLEYFIVARHSGKCLDLAYGQPADETAIWQWQCYGGTPQMWRLGPPQ
jgi:hypothetical protein